MAGIKLVQPELMAMAMPTGTVTFLFTDIEGSTKLWEQHPQTMRDALARHDVLMHQSIAAHDGIVFKTIGDAFCGSFHTATDALKAALSAQQALQSEIWPDSIQIRVRMALHTGVADERAGDYFGPPLNRVARLLSTGHGGQTLLSLATYELTRDALPAQCTLQNLGAHSLRDLARPEQVYQLCHPDLLAEFAPLKSLDYLPNNLPLQLTSFVGREKELNEVSKLLGKTRLLTMTGSGGCGKTRLSLQAAADVLDIFPDGVWLVELAPLTNPDLVSQAVAAVLGVIEQPGKTYLQALIEHLKAKTLLLVLDNCEHVLTTCIALTDVLLRNCPNVKVLASSREGLGIIGEQTYRVPSLSLPDPKITHTPESLFYYEAASLFIERALLVQSDFVITYENAPALASVCHRLDGIPLAIELAASRVRSLSVDEINARLDNRFRLLTGGSKTALPRQQTLRALIDWSYDMLTEPEKALLVRLSVFSGGWTLSAAETVCAGDMVEDWEVLDLLTSLVDKSLVQAEAQTETTRYRFLETVRQYARDRLAESNGGVEVRERHRDYYLKVAEEVRPKLKGSEQAHWLAVLETEHDNLRQAITFCQEDSSSAEKGLRLGSALWQFWWTRGHLREGRERLTAVLSHPEAMAHTQARANALNGTGDLAEAQGDYVAGRTLYEDALQINRELGNRVGEANNLNALGNLAVTLGDYAAARSQYEQNLTIYRELRNRRGIAASLGNLGIVAADQGDYSAARIYYEDCLAIYRGLADRQSIAGSLHNLGDVAAAQGDYAAESLYEEARQINRELGNRAWEAINLGGLGTIAQMKSEYDMALSYYEESLAIRRALGSRDGIASSLSNLGSLALAKGDSALAWSYYAESLALFHETGNKQWIAISLLACAALAVKEDQSERAICLLGAAEALREEMGSPLSPLNLEEHDKMVAASREMLSDEAFATAWAAGQAMSWERAVEYASQTSPIKDSIPEEELFDANV